MHQGDGNEKLDFTYIDDLVQGIVRIIHDKKAMNQILILHKEGKSLNDMAKIILKEFPNVSLENITRDNLIPERLLIYLKQKFVNYAPEYVLIRVI